jgi:phospholipid/cholesterol/gamma-HCH transport system substrate-binding protein
MTPLPPPDPIAPARVERKASWLLALLLALLLGSAVYLLYARGVFERTQTLVLVADDSEGVTVGMDLTFSGFPVGRVRRIELGGDGYARILVDVPLKDARWLRESSIFTMERSLVGATRIRAYSGILSDPPLPDGAERRVLKGDAMAEIPRLVSSVRDLLEHLNAMTAADAPLNASLQAVQGLTERMNGPDGVLGALVGNRTDRDAAMRVLADSSALLQRLEAVAGRTEALVAQADRQFFGDAGVVRDVQGTLQAAQAVLQEARGNLQRLDGILQEAQGIAANTRAATVDLDALRAEVERSLRQVESLVNELQRKWPFARDTEVKLP